MKRPILLLALFLAACGHTQEPGIKAETVHVPYETQKPCPGEVPVRPDPLGELPRDLRALVAILGAKLAEYADNGKYADQAELYFKTCPPAE